MKNENYSDLLILFFYNYLCPICIAPSVNHKVKTNVIDGFYTFIIFKNVRDKYFAIN